MYATGCNESGQLGIGSTVNCSFEPVLVPGLDNVRTISAWNSSAAITDQNELFVWGSENNGLSPTLYESKRNLSKVKVGGKFTLVTDLSNKMFTLASDQGLEPVPSLEDYCATQAGVGANFAFVVGDSVSEVQPFTTRSPKSLSPEPRKN